MPKSFFTFFTKFHHPGTAVVSGSIPQQSSPERVTDDNESSISKQPYPALDALERGALRITAFDGSPTTPPTLENDTAELQLKVMSLEPWSSFTECSTLSGEDEKMGLGRDDCFTPSEGNFTQRLSTNTLSPLGEDDDASDSASMNTFFTAFEFEPRGPKGEGQPSSKAWKASISIAFRVWFNTYRKLFTLIIILNAVGLVLATTGVWAYPKSYPGAFVLGNLQVAVLFRNELFSRFVHLVVTTLFSKWPPLRFRLALTSILQHSGGIHSGCAMSAFAWLVFRITYVFLDRKRMPESILITGVATNAAVAVSIVAALPWVRNTHHNVFERLHRFVGWCGLLTAWAFIVLRNNWDPNMQTWNSDWRHIFRQQDYWFLFGITIFVIIPWFFVRKVVVKIENPSSRVAILHFERGMQPGLFTRISRTPFLEYHAFGTVSDGPKSNNHRVICGVQGDFTREIVNNPPTHVWTRELKFAGISNTAKMYKRGIELCTGSGIGGALSTCLQNPDWHLIWICSDVERTFGEGLVALIHEKLPPMQYTIWDTKVQGSRPDAMKLIQDTYTSWNAEVVFITSNFNGNKIMMEGCKAAGIPAFGALWDF